MSPSLGGTIGGLPPAVAAGAFCSPGQKDDWFCSSALARRARQAPTPTEPE